MDDDDDASAYCPDCGCLLGEEPHQRDCDYDEVDDEEEDDDDDDPEDDLDGL